MSVEQTKHLVVYTDGSCNTNPGTGGAGVYGFVYKLTEKNKNYKHPVHATLNYTTKGVFQEKDEQCIEVVSVIEVIKALYTEEATNNLAELEAFIIGLQKVYTIEGLKSVTIYTDSNYIVSSFNEHLDRWSNCDYKKLDGKPVKHRVSWENILYHRNRINELGISITVEWVKAHVGFYCNEMADIYSAVGSNSARRQFRDKINPFNEIILDRVSDYSEYKKSYKNKDLILHFRDLYFNSASIDDNIYCFLASSEDQQTIGRRDISSIFAFNTGYVPDVVNVFKRVFRSIERNYTTTCCIKLNKLDNKDVLRLTDIVNPEDLLVYNEKDNSKWFSIVRDNSPFIFENGYEYPFIINASKLFNKMVDLSVLENRVSPEIIDRIDITDKIIKDNKLCITNKDLSIDLSDRVNSVLTYVHKPTLTIGYDIPNYLSLKKLEEDIDCIEVIVTKIHSSNYATFYTNIHTKDRNLYTVNIENKFLVSNVRSI